MLKPIQSELLNSFPGIKHAFFTRQGGVSQDPFDSLNFCIKRGDTPENVLENRRRAAAWFGVDELQLCIPHLIHEDAVVVVDQPFNRDKRPKADAAVTSHPEYIVGITMADCVPVLLVDPKKGVVAAVHAGWRGALKGIVERTIDSLEAQGGKRHHIYAAIGPAIQQESYEVGEEVYQAFANANTAYKTFFEPSNVGHYQFDLPGLVQYRLQKANVAEIDWLKIDTYTNPELFFSCRRNAHNGIKIFGDMMAGIMLKG
jgi:YfiH family protein